MKNLAIITARGGSKRIPNKNIKNFCGKPIIEYSISAAIKSKVFDEVMVSTDSEAIANIARKAGAVIPFMRSEKNSDDYATTAEVLIEVLKSYKNINKEFDNICCIYPTAPFVTPELLIKANEMLNNGDATSVITVTEFSFPPQRGFVIKDNKLNYREPENRNKRSQDLEKIYHDCGQIYFIKTENLLNDKSLITENTASLIIEPMQVQDIDTISDWELAELKFRLINREKSDE